MSDQARMQKIGAEFAAALSAGDASKMEELAASAGKVLASVEADVFFSAEENRAELVKLMDAKLVEATTSVMPELASARIKGLWGRVASRLDDEASVRPLVRGAARIAGEAGLARALCSALEAEAVATGEGRVADKNVFSSSCLGPVIGVTSIVPTAALWEPRSSSEPRVAYFRDLPGFPRVRLEAFRRQANFLRAQLYGAQDAAVSMVEKCLKVDKKRRQDAVLAWLARGLAVCEESGARLNLAYVALRLAAPLVEDSDKGRGLLRKVDMTAGLKFGRGFPDEAPLLETDEVVSDDPTAAAAGTDTDDDDEEAALLAKAVEMSLDSRNATPLGFRGTSSLDFLTEIFWLAQRALGAVAAVADAMRDELKRVRAGRDEDAVAAAGMIHRGGWVTHLHDPRLLEVAGAVATASTKLVVDLSRRENAVATFSRVPASVVKRACDIWSLQLQAAAGESLFDPKTAATLCCALMKRPDLITSPVVHAKLVDVVSTMMFASSDRSTDVYAAPGRRLRRQGDQLHGAVMDDSRIRSELPVALATLYAQLHAIVGLDVDRDDGFDKFAVRHRINDLLLRLWRHPLGEPKKALQEYLRDNASITTACLDNIVYCAEDAVDRIRDGKAIEDAAAKLPEKPGTTTLADRLDPRRKHYYDAQRRATRGFLDIAISTLELVAELPVDFGSDSVASRAASLSLSLLNTFGGGGGASSVPRDLDVEDPRHRWGFDRPLLASHLVQLAIKVHARRPDALASAAQTADFDAYKVLAATNIPAIQQPEQPEQNPRAPDATVAALDAAIAKLKATEDVEADYAAAFDSRVPAVDLVPPGTISDYYFRDRPSATVKHLQRELRRLERDVPPPHVDGSVFARFDESNLQTARCCVAGPVDTPYFGGLFVFDVFYVSSYPALPPLVQLVTTGNGLARFNPNLYADGKVCLSLLGTWHAADETQKWNPKTSNLRQILLSIQAEILVAEPYFNEPGRDLQRGTPEGSSASAALNADLRLKTIRYAINDHLRRPPEGLEPVVKAHFDKVRPKLLKQCRRDVLDAPPHLQAATKRAVDDLINLLDRNYPAPTDDHLPPPPPKRAKQHDDALADQQHQDPLLPDTGLSPQP
ncbi:hypothetical protein CTAYLR_007283 [Chrysophaeum taylorii]|uniref:UBC core domain-containing protein n=1 Tax=Chrysophaeum taylorii TaxID=2483200 RepID=A0AAD7UII6_9STRA|nr:hypothetical protein CTAYLR_007283 [Chrysophaeum taylorii]